MPPLTFDQERVPLKLDQWGVARVAGTKVALEGIIALYRQGFTPEQIQWDFDVVTLGDVYSVIGYYLRRKEEVDQYMQERNDDWDKFVADLESQPGAKEFYDRIRDSKDLRKGGKMNDWALFINGIFDKVLADITAAHSRNPETTLFLQPFTGGPIVRLRDNIPSLEVPVTLYASTTDNLSTISYTADIVGWENKRTINPARRQEVDSILEKHQPTEPGLEGNSGINLIHVRRMTKLATPFSVGELIKISDGKPLSAKRSRAGGFSYIRTLDTRPAPLTPPASP